MEKEDVLEIKKILHETLDERKSISEATHRRHHHFVDYLEAKAKRKVERMERVKTTVLGWLVITLIIGAGSVAWQWAVHLIKTVKSGG